MSPTLRHSLARSTSETSSDNGAIAYLRVVETEAYADWESVYRDNVGRLYRLMYSRVGNRPDAEDLTSEVFRTVLRPLQLGSSKGEVRAYLLTTAQTVLATHWRRTLGISVTSIDPEVDAVVGEERDEVATGGERAAFAAASNASFSSGVYALPT